MAGLTGCSPDANDESATRGASASASVPATNAAGLTGQNLYQPCLLCHSTKEMQRGPILNGLPAWYVRGQTQKFRDGIRGSIPENRSAALMAGAVGQLTNSNDITLVAEHIASLPVLPHLQTVRGDPARGRQVYLMCVLCHGDKAQGNPTVKGPPLNVQEDWYLLDQLRKFKAGLRGKHFKDLEGQSMAGIMAGLDDAQLRDVVAYVINKLSLAAPRDAKSGDPGPAK